MEDYNVIHVLILWIPEDPHRQEFLSSGRGTESPSSYLSKRIAKVWNFQKRQITHPTLQGAAHLQCPSGTSNPSKATGHIPMGFHCLYIHPKKQKSLLPLGLKAMQQMGFSWAGKWATMPSLSESSLTSTWGTEHSPGLAGKPPQRGIPNSLTQGWVCEVSHSV